MTAENWLTLIGIISSGLAGYVIKYTLDKKAQFSSENAKIKREIYSEFVDFTLKFLSDTQEQKADITAEQQKQLIKKMKNFHRKAVLYSSPKVINAYSDMLQNSYRGNGESFHTMVLMTNIFREMRKDIGLSNRGLCSGAIRLMRPLINNYDMTIRPQEIGLLLKAQSAIKSTPKQVIQDEEKKK